ncbi:MAG: sugar transferase [Rhodothermales bacterium]
MQVVGRSRTKSIQDPLSKRLFDVAAASVGLALLSPLFALIACGIKLHDGGPVFYRGIRIGRHGAPFKIIKFRTMVADADRSGPRITTSADPRVTALGHLLRQFKVDELPQLVNVIRGEMSLVGPRPEDPRYVAEYSPDERRILDVRPGMTSAASLEFRDEACLLSGPDWERTYRAEILPRKLQTDLHYAAHRTLRSDVALIARTFRILLTQT